MSVKSKLNPLSFSCERAYVDGRATNFCALVGDNERQVNCLERDVGWVMQSRREVGIDILVFITAAASCNPDIAETGGVSEAIDAYVRSYYQQGQKCPKMGSLPFRADVTLKGMLEMVTSPIVVLATTSTEPLSSNSIPWESVTTARNAANTALFKDWRGCFEKEISRSATFPVDKPPTVLERGSLSYTKTNPINIW